MKNNAQPSTPVSNVLSVDVEDWYQLTGEQVAGRGALHSDSLMRQMDRLLELLERHNCRATFFCLGKSLESIPQLVTRIAGAGHEVASHGWGHELIRDIGIDRFRDDLRRSLDWLSSILGRSVLGYRAPAFSVPKELLEEFHDVCFEARLVYDSSVFPIKGRRYGIPGFPLGPTVVREDGERRLIEMPLATLEFAGRRWPVAGGGYWRLLPKSLLSRAIARINHSQRPVISYHHPYEFDSVPLDATEAAGRSMKARRRGLTQNLGRSSVYGKLDAILSRFEFGSAEDYLKNAKLI